MRGGEKIIVMISCNIDIIRVLLIFYNSLLIYSSSNSSWVSSFLHDHLHSHVPIPNDDPPSSSHWCPPGRLSVSSKSFKDSTDGKNMTVGNLWDKSKEMSEKRAQKLGTKDPVKEKYESGARKVRKGKQIRD